MRKIAAIIVSVLFAVPALAHPGHVANHGVGHDHFGGLAALALAAVVMGIAGVRAAVRRGAARRVASREDSAA